MFENHKRRKLGGSRLVRRGRERRWKKGVLPWEKGGTGASSGMGTPRSARSLSMSISNDGGERRENNVGLGGGKGSLGMGLKELTMLEELGEEELEEGGAGFWFGKRRGEGLGRGEEGEREGALVGLSFHGGAFVAGTSLETVRDKDRGGRKWRDGMGGKGGREEGRSTRRKLKLIRDLLFWLLIPQDGTANIPKHLIARTAIKDVLSVDVRSLLFTHSKPKKDITRKLTRLLSSPFIRTVPPRSLQPLPISSHRRLSRLPLSSRREEHPG